MKLKPPHRVEVLAHEIIQVMLEISEQEYGPLTEREREMIERASRSVCVGIMRELPTVFFTIGIDPETQHWWDALGASKKWTCWVCKTTCEGAPAYEAQSMSGGPFRYCAKCAPNVT